MSKKTSGKEHKKNLIVGLTTLAHSHYEQKGKSSTKVKIAHSHYEQNCS
jgi:phenylpyruvate tautomerase PptA (4-oxalocrotonate tautomerase family)